MPEKIQGIFTPNIVPMTAKGEIDEDELRRYVDWLIVTSGVVPELTRKLYDLTRNGRIAEAMHLQFRMLELFDAMLYSADFPEGFRAAVELRGFRVGAGRQPRTDKQIIDHAMLQNVLRCILADFGYVEGPAGGCPPRTGNIDQDRISHIAATVLDTLRQRGAL